MVCDGFLQSLEVEFHLLLRSDMLSDVCLILLDHLLVLHLIVGPTLGDDRLELSYGWELVLLRIHV